MPPERPGCVADGLGPAAGLAWRVAAAGLLLLSWSALLLAQLSRFSLGNLFALTVAAALLVAVIFRRDARAALAACRERPAVRPGLAAAGALAALLAVAALLLSRPGEDFVGGWDPGVYLAAGGDVAGRGGLISRDPLLASLSPPEREALVPAAGSGLKYPGYYIRDAAAGTVVPAFQPLYPALLAVALAAGGPRAMLAVNPLLALLGIALLFRLAAALRGPRWGLLAAAFLALNVVELWNARFATSELAAQALLLAGFNFLLDFLEAGSLPAGLFAALGFGLAPMATVTTLLVLPIPLLAVLAPGPGAPPRRAAAAFLVPYAAVLAHGMLWSAWVAPRYLGTLFGYFPVLRHPLAAGAGALALLAAVPFGVALLADDPAAPPAPRARRAGAAAAAALSVALAWLWFARPLLSPSLEAQNLPRLAWFLSPVVIALFAAGAAALLSGPRRRAESAFLIAAAAMLLFFLHDKRMYPSYPFSLRRYTPLAIPGIAFCASWLPARLLGDRRGPRRAAGAALLALALALPLWQNRDLVRRTAWRGLLSFLEDVDRSLPRGGVALFQGRLLAYPLEHVFGRTAAVLDRTTPAQAAGVEGWLRRRAAAGEATWLVSHAERPWCADLLFEPLFARRLRSERLGQELYRYPDRVEPVDLEVTAYRVRSAASPDAGDAFPARVDLGENALCIGGGFPAAVRLPPAPGERAAAARWTGARAELTVPWPSGPGTVDVVLRAASGRGRLEAARVRLTLDGAPLGGEVAVPERPAEITFRTASPGDGRTRRTLGIVSTTWNPGERGIAGYPDGLGVLVDWVEIRPAAGR
jgi:hypothetical protein